MAQQMRPASVPCSSGSTEGNVNRQKTIKRQMYGRASLNLLRKRVIYHSAQPDHGIRARARCSWQKTPPGGPMRVAGDIAPCAGAMDAVSSSTPGIPKRHAEARSACLRSLDPLQAAADSVITASDECGHLI